MCELVQDTVMKRFSHLALCYPEKTALWSRNQKITYREMDTLTDQLSAGLLTYGLHPGSHVAILGEPDIPLILTFFGLQKIGCVVALLNTCLQMEEIKEQIISADCEYLVVGKSFKDNFGQELKKISESCKSLVKYLFYVGDLPDTDYIKFDAILYRSNLKQAALLLEKAKNHVSSNKPALMLATSGTTGSHPKQVVLSMFHLVNGGLIKAKAQNITTDDIICCAMPMFHIFCMDVNVMAALMTGACLYLPDNRRTKTILSSVENAKCTVLSAVPSIYFALLARLEQEEYDISSLRTGIIGGAYCPPEKFCEIENKLGMILLSGLGQTEAAAGIAVSSYDDPIEIRSVSVGHIVENMEAKIIDTQTGQPVAQGKAGEICIRGKMVMMGYYKEPLLTKKAFDSEGWLHTGDIGYFDEAGNLYLKARIKDLINRGGEKINPNEVECAILSVPKIKACKVVPVPDDHYGEEACAVIECKAHEDITEKEIRKYLACRIAEFKIPKYFLFIDHLPRTATGKYRQKDIIKIAKEKLDIK